MPCCSDKFLVQYVALTGKEFSSLSEEDSSELQHKLTALVRVLVVACQRRERFPQYDMEHKFD